MPNKLPEGRFKKKNVTKNNFFYLAIDKLNFVSYIWLDNKED